MHFAPTSKLLASPRGSASDAFAFIDRHPNGHYESGAVRGIVDRYWDTCTTVGLDPFFVVVQLSLETGFLSSFWSQRPRRNPAGIGVTGAPGEGVQFASWDKAVRAHTGRLLAYVIDSGHGTPVQRALIGEALAVRPLPSDRRGVAPTLGGLEGTWATDTEYAEKLVKLGNEMLA
jgi:hypothetical protein